MTALPNEDRVPHDRATWREGNTPPNCEGFRMVSVDYGDGLIEKTFVDKANWAKAKRWRFGWPPA